LYEAALVVFVSFVLSELLVPCANATPRAVLRAGVCQVNLVMYLV
jgi:hypothetical protein